MSDAVECFFKGLENNYKENENNYHSLVIRFLLISNLLNDNMIDDCHEEIRDTYQWLKNEAKYPIDKAYIV